MKVITKPSAKLKDIAHRKIDTISNDETSCIYVIPFTDKVNQKEFKYIDMTTRKFKDSIKEHITDMKYSKPSTALSRLNQKQDIDIDFSKARFKAHTSSYYTSLIRELFEILTQKKEYLQ